MVIEWLRFKVSSQSRERFIQQDNEIWTNMLKRYPGFLGKEVWINPNLLEEIIIVIRWETYQHWQSIPQTILDETEQQFAQQMGENKYQIIEQSEYQVRKFPEVLK